MDMCTLTLQACQDWRTQDFARNGEEQSMTNPADCLKADCLIFFSYTRDLCHRERKSCATPVCTCVQSTRMPKRGETCLHSIILLTELIFELLFPFFLPNTDARALRHPCGHMLRHITARHQESEARLSALQSSRNALCVCFVRFWVWSKRVFKSRQDKRRQKDECCYLAKEVQTVLASVKNSYASCETKK